MIVFGEVCPVLSRIITTVEQRKEKRIKALPSLKVRSFPGITAKLWIRVLCCSDFIQFVHYRVGGLGACLHITPSQLLAQRFRRGY